MIDLHYWPTPNGKKVSIFLEETETPYRLVPVNIGRGDQFTPEFLKLNPNHRMPVIVDHAPNDGGPAISLGSRPEHECQPRISDRRNNIISQYPSLDRSSNECPPSVRRCLLS